MYDCVLSILHLKNKLNWTELNQVVTWRNKYADYTKQSRPDKMFEIIWYNTTACR